MINILTLALIVAIVGSAVAGSIAVQIAAVVALLCLSVIFSIVGRFRKTEEEEIGLPDHEGSQVEQACEEFLASEAEREAAIVDPLDIDELLASGSEREVAIVDSDDITGKPARYYSVRLGKMRPAIVMAYFGRDIYSLAIENKNREVVTINRRRDNFQLV